MSLEPAIGPAQRPAVRHWLRLLVLGCIYVLLAALALGANPFAGETVGPFDLLAKHDGWNPGGEKIEVLHHERSDILDGLLPSWLESRRQLRDGILPLWNPHAAGGSPALADPTKAMMTVGFAFFAAAPDPALGFYLGVLASLAIAGLGMHLLVGHSRSQAAALLAGTGFMLCGFMAAWLYWPHVQTAIWIPWLLLGIHRYIERGSVWALYCIVTSTVLMLLGGFPFVTAIGLGSAAVHISVLAYRRRLGNGRMRSVIAIAGVALAFMLAAIPLLSLATTIESADLGHRLGGSILSLKDAALLLPESAAEEPRVETNMYVGLAALLLAMIGLWPLIRRRAESLTISAFILMAIGAILTFGLLPDWVGRNVPVLSNNPWSRAILLLDIGILILAAAGLDQLRAWVGRAPGILISLAVIGLQWFDLEAQFRRFNGPVQDRYFFAAEPELKQFASRLQPFQYIAQDNAQFMVSGTLSALGLGDWFAHSLRTRGMRELLVALAEEPFTTPTATSIGIQKYKWQTPIADAVAMCYAIHRPGQTLPAVVHQAPGNQRRPVGPINEQPVRQLIDLPEALEVSAISIRVATYRATALDGWLQMTLQSLDGESKPMVVRMPASEARDNAFLLFELSNTMQLPAGNHQLQLEYFPGPRNKNLTIWLLTDAGGDVEYDNERVPGRMEYRLHGGDPGLITQRVGERFQISRNPDCAPGAYLTRDSGGTYLPGGAQHVSLVEYKPHAFRFQVDAPESAKLVVPMRHASGWAVRVDGKLADIVLVRDVMPAVSVPTGRSTVEFRYAPPYWKIGLFSAAVSLLLLAWFSRLAVGNASVRRLEQDESTESFESKGV